MCGKKNCYFRSFHYAQTRKVWYEYQSDLRLDPDAPKIRAKRGRKRFPDSYWNLHKST